MILRTLRVVLLFPLVLLVSATAHAHEPMLVAPSSEPLTLGTATPPRLIHTTLTKPGEQLIVTVDQGSGIDPMRVQLLIPDRLPERDRGARDAQPSFEVTQGTKQPMQLEPVFMKSADALVDEGTGLAYLSRGEGMLASGTSTITVRRGPKPVRVALLIGPEEPFATTDPARVQRTMMRVHVWYNTPAPGSKVAPSRPQEDASFVNKIGAWFAAFIALIAIVTAVWWMLSGRTRARVRGIERSHEQQQP